MIKVAISYFQLSLLYEPICLFFFNKKGLSLHKMKKIIEGIEFRFSFLEAKYRNFIVPFYLLFTPLISVFVQLSIKLLAKLGSFEVAYLRCLGTCLLLFFLISVKKYGIVPSRKLNVFLVIGILSFGDLCLSYYGIQHIPLSDATVLMQTSPIFTGIFGSLLLNEPYPLSEKICSILCFLGVICIARPHFLLGR